jgi:flagella basal body P-ring formation protein FlgA
MIRLSALLMLALAMAVANAASGAVLKPAASIEGNLIHVADLFADAGTAATDTVAAAPAVGMQTTYGADWLAAVAHEHKLDWAPRSPFDQITVTRATRTIGADDIEAGIMGEIARRQPIENADIQLDNPGLRLVVAADTPSAIAIDGLTIEHGSGRFSAIVSAPAGDPNAQHLRVAGLLIYRVEVPEPIHAIPAGAVIGMGDLAMVRVRRDRVDPGAASDPQQLVGKSPRRPLAADTPVRVADVAAPFLIHRGDLVTIVLKTDNLELTAQGTALEDGAQAAIVRIQNTKSSRVIDATVTGQDMVAVQPPGAAFAQRTAER